MLPSQVSVPHVVTALYCVATTSLTTTMAAEAEKRTFNLPRGDAAETLKDFATAAGTPIVYLVDRIRGATTNSVSGELTPREALEQMLINTDLEAAQDPITGGLVVSRKLSTRKDPANHRQTTKPPKMKTSRNIIAIAVAWIASAVTGDAQITSATNGVIAQSTAAVGNITGRVKNIVTDQYLNNAEVRVAGTEIVSATNSDGSYFLANVPAGDRELVVQYTGLDTQRIPLQVPAGGSVSQAIDLTSVARYGTDRALLKLDAFRVTADRDLNSQNVATNEQRYASNIKTALATDSFGSQMANSVGEFMKFIPGVSVSNAGNANEITEFSVRGIGGAMSSFTQDGAPMVFGSFSPSSRIFNPYTSDLNSTARLEVTKVPRPSDPAESIGGSINLITKSAFDHARAVGNFNLGVNISGRNLDSKFWQKTPTTLGDRTNYKSLPSGSFDYSLPLSKDFGIFVSFLHFPKASLLTQMRTPYQTAGVSTGATVSNPYMQSLFEFEGPRTYTKTNFSFKADWRVTPFSVLSFNIATGINKTLIGNSYRNIDAGSNGTSTVVGGTNLSFSDTSTNGATGRGIVQLVGLFQEFNGGTTSPSLSFRHDDGRWRVEGRVSSTTSYMEKDNPDGTFAAVNASLRVPARVNFGGVRPDNTPASAEVFDNANATINLNSSAVYKIDSAQEIFYRNKAKALYYEGKVQRRLALFSFPSSIEVGASKTVKNYQNRGWTGTLTYNGPDGVAATVDPIPAEYLMQVYRNTQVALVGGGYAPFVSPDRLWAAWNANPNLLTQTPAQVVAQESNRRMLSQDIEETVNTAYVQAEARLLNGRLHLLTGVRFEKTADEGTGSLFEPTAVFQRNPNGSFARTSGGARIRLADAGAAGSLQELNLTTIESGARGEKSYDGYYPSLHLTYNLRENLLVRAAYASSFGRPDYTQIIPGLTITEADLTSDQMIDPNLSRGTVGVNNTGLKPWTADNYDLSLEYYTKNGGLFTAGVFLKDISDFFGATSRLATQADLDLLGLDDRYLNWLVNTRFNSGAARVSGIEFNARQSLSGFGEWGKSFTVFANATKLKLEGANNADFSSFTPETANWGVSYGRNRIYAGLKWNYTGEVRRAAAPAVGAGGYTYFQPVLATDVDLGYSLTPRLMIALSVSNLTNEATVWHTYASPTPDRARHFMTFTSGSHWALSLKGTF